LEEKNIVHRDIKPENIIVSVDGKVYFLDFGIARILGVPSLTKTEALVGPHTPGYAAPEQFNNLKSDIDSRADLFSIGVVTYECLSGKNPFSEGATSHLDILQRTETITPVSFKIPGDTQQQFMGLLSSLMGKFPSRRPKDATQALNWLSAAKSTFQNVEAKK
jgi:serine/threonine-protein kinase